MLRSHTSFFDRHDAGRTLAQRLDRYHDLPNGLVIGLPRGGVVVAFEVAMALALPLDVFIVRKLGVPRQPELAFGALASGDVVVMNDEVVQAIGLSVEHVAPVIERERQELRRREREYRGAAPPLVVAARNVILVDDGLATGSTMRAAVAALRKLGPERLILAAPVGAPEVCEALRDLADDVVCAVTPEPFHAVGAWYEDFSQTSDEEVKLLLRQAQSRYAAAESTAASRNVSTS